MALKTIKKVNLNLKFLYRDNKFLTPELRLSFKAIIQLYLVSACSARYPNSTWKLNKTL